MWIHQVSLIHCNNLLVTILVLNFNQKKSRVSLQGMTNFAVLWCMIWLTYQRFNQQRERVLAEGGRIAIELKFRDIVVPNNDVTRFIGLVAGVVLKCTLFNKKYSGASKYGIMYSSLDVFGMIIEWGCGPAGISLIMPHVNPQAIFASVPVRTKQFHFINVFLHPIDTFNLVVEEARQAWQTLSNYFATHFNIGEVSERDLRLLAEICTKYIFFSDILNVLTIVPGTIVRIPIISSCATVKSFARRP